LSNGFSTSRLFEWSRLVLVSRTLSQLSTIVEIALFDIVGGGCGCSGRIADLIPSGGLVTAAMSSDVMSPGRGNACGRNHLRQNWNHLDPEYIPQDH
jgi:hypothetical protein